MDASMDTPSSSSVAESTEVAKLPSRVEKVLNGTVIGLENGVLSSSTEIALHCSKLYKLSSSAVWTDAESDGSSDEGRKAAALASIERISEVLQDALPSSPSIAGTAHLYKVALTAQSSLADAKAAVARVHAALDDSHSSLVDNLVSTLAGGPVTRRIAILSSSVPAAVEEAVSEAAEDMDALFVTVISRGKGSAGTAERLASRGAVAHADVVSVAGAMRALRGNERTHALVLDAAAVVVGGETLVFAQVGAAMAAAAAKAAGVRVFAGVETGCVIRSGENVVKEMKRAKDHPGKVLDYAEAMRDGRVRVLNPVYDVLDARLVDVIVCGVAVVAMGAADALAAMVDERVLTLA